MYSNSEILEKIHNNDDYYESVQNITKGHPLADDLYSELLIIFGEYDNEKLNELLENGQLKWYWVRICMNQWNSNTSPFYRKYRKDMIENNKPIIDISYVENNLRDDENYNDILERTYDERSRNDIFYEEPYSVLVRRVTMRTLNDMYWYKSKLFKLYIKLGSYREVSEQTMIPARSIGETIREVKDEIKEEISKELHKMGR